MSPVAREVEHHSLSACTVDAQKSILIKPNESDSNNWTQDQTNNNNNDNETDDIDITKISEAYAQNAVIHSIVPYTEINPGTTIRISPMEWKCGGWDEEHFHPNLRIPINRSSSSGSNKGIVITLEAMARECVAVALSPNPNYELGKTYAIHIGAGSNLQTVIRRHLNYEEAVDVQIPSPRICSDRKFVAYWIILQNNGQVSVGLGKTPGKKCIGTLDDSMYHALRSGVDAVKFVGLGNSALGRKARDLKVRNVKVMPIPDAFGAFGGIPLTPFDPDVDSMDDSGTGRGASNGNYNDDTAEKDTALWAEYQKECEKAKKRAVKFGIEYKQPAPDAFFKWSEARRLRHNPEKGFITGMDIMSTEEKEKARKRKQRFEEEARKNRAVTGGEDNGNADGDMNMNADADADVDADADADLDGGNDRKKREPYPLDQAWDNEDLISEMRVDPPESLLKKTNETTTAGDSDGNGDGTSMDDNDNEVQAQVQYVPTKIHVFAIDWAAFKQIRTDDILAFFKIYGPTYVEWLGELSCNVHFEDKYSAARALEALSRALPADIPLSKTSVDNGASSDGAGDMIIKVEDTLKIEDISSDKPEETMEDDVKIADENGEPSTVSIKTEDPKPISTTNLGAMGWRFCNFPIRKLQSDRFGKKGSRSRCIFRIATSLDCLDEKPTTWPKPPPGFTTKHVLGPGDDFKTHSDRRKRKGRDGGGGKRRRRSRGSHGDQWEHDRSDNYGEYDDDAQDYHETDEFGRAAIDTGLKAGRAGFSVEQMEAERNANNN